MDTQTENQPERRTPNTGTTEAQWLEVVEAFKGGEPAVSIAQRRDLSPAAVNAQLQKRGVYRRDHPVRRKRSALPAPVTAEGEPAPMPLLMLPETTDPIAVADALEDWSGRLLRAGFHGQAREATRMAREKLSGLSVRMRVQMLASGAVEDAEFEDVTPAAPPTLRLAQTPPEGDWRTWLFLGGRGAGKTLAGAAWLAARAEHVGRLALIGPTLGDVREVMIEGPSGLRGAAAAFGPGGRSGRERPVYIPSRRRLVWSNGAAARVFTAEDPDGLRGPQFAAAWADEVCAWREPESVLAMVRMGLRLSGGRVRLAREGVGCGVLGVRENAGGAEKGVENARRPPHPAPHTPRPQLVLTTTPRPTPGLRALLAEPGLAVTRGSALDNAEHLAPGFVEGLRALYGGTRLERQEIDGEVLEAPEGGVFRYADIARARELGAGARPARFARVVVAVDRRRGRPRAGAVRRAGSSLWVQRPPPPGPGGPQILGTSPRAGSTGCWRTARRRG